MAESAEAQFAFAVCQAGAETVLKRELARTRPELRFAFSRPGFVTFRGTGLSPELDLGGSIFARAFGQSIGKASGDLAAAILAKGRELDKPRLHLFEREQFPPGEAPKDFRGGEWTAKLKAKLAQAGEWPFKEGDLAQNGELVLDVILVEENEVWFGLHRHSAAHSPYPGGNPGLELPADAPSRAWLKLEEAVRYPGVPLKEGDIAIELGAAPGGAVVALLNRGLKVYGVDSGEMDAKARANPRFKWLCASAKEALAGGGGGKLPDHAEWLVLDIHARGELALKELEPYVERYRDKGLLGLVLTLKLGSWKMADFTPRWLEKVREMGMATVRATHLPGNKQEFCVVAMTPKGRVARP